LLTRQTTAKIYQRPQSAMTSGKARNDEWILQYDPADRQVADPMTGWAGSQDTRRQLKMRFDSREDAVSYAERNGIDARVEEPPVHRLKLQAYSDNFR
ncbi:MAG: NADH dehydrogenase ubiquinone Fe-S protein 4, partial [Pacificimonas sp.]